MKKNRKLIAVVGPTASGKTALGIFLARKFGSEIVSADSRQIYRGLDIGTGKDLKEYDDVKYHLIDICEPGAKFTLFDYLEQARLVIEDIFTRGRIPIIVGGTGLYVQALIEGYQLTKNSKLITKNHNLKLKNYSRQELDKMPIAKLKKIIQKYLPNQANEVNKAIMLDMNNSRRLIRFIERAQEGVVAKKEKPDFEVLQIGINLPREELYQKIDRRVDERFKQGMLEEVEGLIARGVNANWLLSLGLEYRIITDYILINPKSKSSQLIDQSTNNFASMKQNLRYKSHAYARRQLTWFRRFPEIKWVKSKEEALELARKFVV